MTFDEKNEAYRKQMAVFIPNRRAFPLDELERYQDRYIAFNPEGTRIIAATEQLETLVEQVQAAGYDPELCPVEFVS